MKSRLFALRAATFAASAAALSCGGGLPPEPAPVAPPPRRDTQQIAEEIAGGRVGLLVYMDRVRKSPMGKQLDEAFHWKEFWEGTGFELERDVEAAFGTTPTLEHPELGVWVTEVNVPIPQVEKAAHILFEKGRVKGHFLDGDAHACDVTLRDGKERRVVFVEPKWVVMMPQDQAAKAQRFAKSGGFPDPIGAESVTMFANDPSKTMLGPQARFEMPASLKSISAVVAFDVEGGIEIGIDGVSTSPAQAKLDAADLTEKLDEATSVGVSKLRVHFIDPIVFRAEADHVVGRRTMPVSEIRSILAFAKPRNLGPPPDPSAPAPKPEDAPKKP